MTVTVCEGQRVVPVREALDGGWECGEARVAAEHLSYIEHWDTICYKLLHAHRKNGKWDVPFTQLLRERANINRKDEALDVVGVITNRTMVDLLTAHARSA